MIEVYDILDQKGVILGRREEEFIDHVAYSFPHSDGLRGRGCCSSCNDHSTAQAIFEEDGILHQKARRRFHCLQES
jgi:radical SAM superfamily enzyme